MVQVIREIKKVFAQELEPLGYVMLKGKYPYFVKVVTPEIINVITIKKDKYFTLRFNGNTATYQPDLREFHVWGGIATVYRKSIDLTEDQEYNRGWMLDNRDIYYNDNIENYDREKGNELRSYYYKKDDKESIIEAAELAVKYTKEYMISKFEQVDTLEKVISFLEIYQINRTYFMRLDEVKDNEWENVDFSKCCNNESLLRIITENQSDLMDIYERGCKEKYLSAINQNIRYTMNEYRSFCERFGVILENQVRIRNKILNTSEIYCNVINELEKRKAYNTEVLRSYGLDI